MISTPVCDLLGIEHPIALGGMGSVFSPPLVAAVSEAGGLGALGCHRLTPEQIRTAVDAWCVVRFSKDTRQEVIWQALHAVLGRQFKAGKICIAVDEDIDPGDRESVQWALSYRMRPDKDMLTVPNRFASLDPSAMPPSDSPPSVIAQNSTGSAVLINATRKWAYPPVSLPARQYMEDARRIWDEIGLPALTPRKPWHGYDLGDWSERDRQDAERAVNGEYGVTGEIARQQRQPILPGQEVGEEAGG